MKLVWAYQNAFWYNTFYWDLVICHKSVKKIRALRPVLKFLLTLYLLILFWAGNETWTRDLLITKHDDKIFCANILKFRGFVSNSWWFFQQSSDSLSDNLCVSEVSLHVIGCSELLFLNIIWHKDEVNHLLFKILLPSQQR